MARLIHDLTHTRTGTIAVLAGLVSLTMVSAASANKCETAEDQATLNQCATDALKTADAKLNSVYHEAQRRLADDPDGKKLLTAAQRDWIAFRDAECSFAASAVDGGSAYPMVHAGCLEKLTTARTEQLQDYLNCEEGDLSCPLPPR